MFQRRKTLIRFGTTWGCVNYDRICIFMWTIPLKQNRKDDLMNFFFLRKRSAVFWLLHAWPFVSINFQFPLCAQIPLTVSFLSQSCALGRINFFDKKCIVATSLFHHGCLVYRAAASCQGLCFCYFSFPSNILFCIPFRAGKIWPQKKKKNSQKIWQILKVPYVIYFLYCTKA